MHHQGGHSELVRRAIAMCRKRRRKLKIADTTGATLTGGELLTRSLVLRRYLRRHVLATDERHVGILLPPTAAAAAVNFALTLDGRTVINLNYTLTSGLLNASIRTAGIRHVLTSRRFMERVELQLDAEIVYLEDLRDRIGRVDKLTGAVMALALPLPLLERVLGLRERRADDPITVMFTSGTTGDPKGAVLSHGNVEFNVDAVNRIIRLTPDDVLVGVLPFFHSFGYAITLWTILTLDVAVAYHTNPLEAQHVGKLCRERKGTILLATPMFLRTYLRRCPPEDFATLEAVVTGAERLPPDVADHFEAKYGLRPVEGYGTTETSPLISANIPASRAMGDPDATARAGTVGKPPPGVRAKVVDLETGADLTSGEQGMLHVTGPNVMLGYLDRPKETAKVIRDGWYVTGDICVIDEDGFIRIVGRESRFAKIGGEMVPHGLVEEALTRVVGVDEDGAQKVVVVSVPDDRRGERLVVVHTPLEHRPEDLQTALHATGLPNLFIPDARSFVVVDALPMLGTGKLDLAAITRLARSRIDRSPA